MLYKADFRGERKMYRKLVTCLLVLWAVMSISACNQNEKSSLSKDDEQVNEEIMFGQLDMLRPHSTYDDYLRNGGSYSSYKQIGVRRADINAISMLLYTDNFMDGKAETIFCGETYDTQPGRN